LIESKVTKEIEEGLGNFSKNYYTLAVKNFNSAKTGYPLSAKVLDPLIAQANEKISQGEDSSPSKTLLGLENEINQGFGLQLSGTTTVYIVLAFVGLLLALI